MLRLTGGELKGRKIKTLKGQGTRPILSRVRKTLFDLIGNKVVEADFLDLFAGTGSVGIEALSRGASRAIFVEKKIRAVRIITENLSQLKLADSARVYRRDVLGWLDLVSDDDEAFDIIFVGPPYFKGLADKTLEQMSESGVVKKDGIIFVQHHRKERISVPGSFVLVEQRKYGDMVLSIIECKTML